MPRVNSSLGGLFCVDEDETRVSRYLFHFSSFQAFLHLIDDGVSPPLAQVRIEYFHGILESILGSKAISKSIWGVRVLNRFGGFEIRVVNQVRPPGVKASKAAKRKKHGNEAAYDQLESMLVVKENISKHRLLERLLARKETLSEIEVTGACLAREFDSTRASVCFTGCLFASRECTMSVCFTGKCRILLLSTLFFFIHGLCNLLLALYINYGIVFGVVYHLSINLQHSASFRSCGIVFGVVYNFYHFFSPKTLNQQSITEHSSNLRIQNSDQPQRA
ncbi:hypothetical protein YC2023_110695 [Brassica napus]